MFRRRSTATAKPTKNHNGFQDGPSSARAEPTSNVTSKKSRGLLLPIPTITFIRGRKDSKTKGDKRLWKKVSFRLAGAATIASKKINTSTKKYSRSGQSFNSSFNEYEEPCEDGMEYFDAEHMVFRNTCTCPNYFSDGTVGGTNLLSKGDPGNINATETCDLKELQFNIFQCYLPNAENASIKSLSTSNHDSRTPRKNNGKCEADNSSACLFRLHENESSSEDHCVLHDHSRSDTVCGHFMIWSILVAWATAEALYIRGNVCMSSGTQPDFQNEDGSSYGFEIEAPKAQIELSEGSLACGNKDEISTVQSHEDDEMSIPSLSTELSWSNSKSPGKSQFVINDNGESNLENVVEVTISLGAFAALLGSPSSLIHRYGSEKRRRCAIQQLWDDSQDMLSLSSDEDAANEKDSVPSKYYIKTHYPAHQGGLVSNEMNAGSNQIDISDSVISLSALMTLLGAPHHEAVRKQLGNQTQTHYSRSLRFKNANSHPSEFDIDTISLSSEDLISHLGTVQVEDVDDDSIPSLDLDFDPAPVGKVCLESIELLNVTATLKTPRTDDLSGSVVILNSITPTSTSPDSKWRTDESCKKGDDSSSDEMIVAGGSTRVNDTASLLQLNDNDHIRNSVNEDTASLPTLRISRDQDVVVKFPHDDNEVAKIDMHCNPDILAEVDELQNATLLGSSSLCSISSKNAEKKNRKFSLPNLSSNDVSDSVLSLSFNEDSSIESDSEHLKGSESNQRAITDPAIAWSESTALFCTAAPESFHKPLVQQNTLSARNLLKEEINLSRYEIDIDLVSLPPTDSYNYVDKAQIQEPDDDTCSIPSLDADCKPVPLQHVDDVMCNGSALLQVKCKTGKDDCARSAVKPSPVPLESTSPETKMIHKVVSNLMGHVPVAGTSEENNDDILSFSFTGNSSDETRCANSPKYIGGQNAIRIDGTSRNSHQNVMVLSMLDDESVPSLSSGSWDDDDLENSLTPYKALSRVKSNGELSLSKVKEKDVTMSVLACGVLAAVVK
mmetsp:Transcript_1885/g.4016  ORF Transcript_1885/g.4016 Transcript_1885/m.4016 type:complete len:1011 (+) Transcript_1885:306-3338(+)